MWRHIGTLVLAGLAAGLAHGQAAAPGAPEAGRGQLLYATHCIACHGQQVHWRDRKAASDWLRLKDEVRRWQAAAGLGWTEADIVAVARYLNETIYRLPQTADVVGRLSPPGATVPAARTGR
ncbi:MAG: cytochrome C [Rubrivivax sp.]|nr:cytochrome C [Rubrivivax sp.]